MGSISHRLSIRFPPAPAAEPTSTLVLTSPGQVFVDVRILRGGSGDDGDDTVGGGLDWAFAGTASVPAPGRRRWEHWVDSRPGPPADDEAEVRGPLDGGGVEVETGRMLDPATGKVADYVEEWREEEVRGGGCVVARVREGAGVRGLLVRLGRYCQGMLRDGEEVTVERWALGEGGEGWKLRARFGGGRLPTAAVIERTGELRVGDEVPAGDRAWVVVEVAGGAGG